VALKGSGALSVDRLLTKREVEQAADTELKERRPVAA
jgi:hypothetical protein